MTEGVLAAIPQSLCGNTEKLRSVIFVSSQRPEKKTHTHTHTHSAQFVRQRCQENEKQQQPRLGHVQITRNHRLENMSLFVVTDQSKNECDSVRCDGCCLEKVISLYYAPRGGPVNDVVAANLVSGHNISHPQRFEEMISAHIYSTDNGLTYRVPPRSCCMSA